MALRYGEKLWGHRVEIAFVKHDLNECFITRTDFIQRPPAPKKEKGG